MVEPEQPKEEKPSKWKIRFSNFVKQWFKEKTFDLWLRRWTGESLKYQLYEGQPITDIQTVRKELKEKGNLLDLMQKRSEAVIQVEKNWDDTDILIEEVENLYAKSMIYFDSTTGDVEYPLFQNARDISQDPLEEIEIEGEKYYYPVPPKHKLRYNIVGMTRDWVVEISPFGYENAPAYIIAYQDLVDKICEDYKARALANATNDTERDNIAGNIDIIKAVHQKMIAVIISAYTGGGEAEAGGITRPMVERRYRSFVKDASEYSGTIKGKYSRANALRKIFTPDNTIYYNSYKIINPVVYGIGKKSAVVLDELRNYEDRTWTTKPDEVAQGLDKYGYPLEVDDEGYVMIDKSNENGYLIPRGGGRAYRIVNGRTEYDPNDRVNHPRWRRVPQSRVAEVSFIKDVDLLEMANYLDNFHDTVRDDLRDGRYHGGTLTIMDYVTANNKSIWNLWNLRNEDDLQRPWFNPRTRQRQFKTEVPIELRGTYAGSTYYYNVSSTDKNPAFDLRYVGTAGEQAEWMYIGRKYYYDVPDGSFAFVSHNQEPHISSRGISMYIIDKITRQLYKWDEVMTISNEVGIRGGFDYGTRPWDMWGREMPANIWEWRRLIDRINEPIPREKDEHNRPMTKEMYAAKYARGH